MKLRHIQSLYSKPLVVIKIREFIRLIVTAHSIAFQSQRSSTVKPTRKIYHPQASKQARPSPAPSHTQAYPNPNPTLIPSSLPLQPPHPLHSSPKSALPVLGRRTQPISLISQHLLHRLLHRRPARTHLIAPCQRPRERAPRFAVLAQRKCRIGTVKDSSLLSAAVGDSWRRRLRGILSSLGPFGCVFCSDAAEEV